MIRINRPLFLRMLEEYPEVTAMVETRIRENIQAMIRRWRRLPGGLRKRTAPSKLEMGL